MREAYRLQRRKTIVFVRLCNWCVGRDHSAPDVLVSLLAIILSNQPYHEGTRHGHRAIAELLVLKFAPRSGGGDQRKNDPPHVGQASLTRQIRGQRAGC
jgi:hypothetical protein